MAAVLKAEGKRALTDYYERHLSAPLLRRLDRVTVQRVSGGSYPLPGPGWHV